MNLDLLQQALANPTVGTYIYCILGVVAAFIVLFFLRYALRSSINKKVRSIHEAPAMSMMDVDQLRKKGLVDETEYKSIRHALAGSEMGRERRKQLSDRERLIMAEAARDPEAARKLLDPELLGAKAADRRGAANAVGPDGNGDGAPFDGGAAPGRPAMQKAPAARQNPASGKPAKGPQGGQIQASPNWPRPRPAAPPEETQAASPAAATPAAAPTATAEGNGQGPSDLDVLLEKGAITLEEYDRLRAFFQ